MHVPPDQDRRKHRRFSLQLEAVVAVGPGQTHERGQLLDLSIGGAAISLAFELPLDTDAYIRFHLPDGGLCEATGRVIRVMPLAGRFGVAFEFGFVNDPLADFLEKLDSVHQAARPDMLAEIRDLHIQVA